MITIDFYHVGHPLRCVASPFNLLGFAYLFCLALAWYCASVGWYYRESKKDTQSDKLN